MAQWKETLEPYVKVIESVKTTAINPTAGEDLIIGAVIISDAGPSVPTLISSQKEFLKTYAAEDLSQKYTDSLNDLYTGDNGELASTMWLNAYRLAGSGTLLISRACKADGIMYAKDFNNPKSHYVLKDNEVLKLVESPIKFCIDEGTMETDGADIAEVTSANDGWAISIKDVGVFGNRVNDNGPLYDYYVDNLYDLVQKLNETTKFYSPDYTFYSDHKCESKVTDVDEDNKHEDEIKAVVFNTLFLAGGGIMEPEVTDAAGNVEYWGKASDGETYNSWGDQDILTKQADVDSTATGCAYLIPEAVNTDHGSSIIDLNSGNYSGFEPPKFYATNLYNSRVDITVRIRRFNHNAVQSFTTAEGSTDSPYKVLNSVLDAYHGVDKNGQVKHLPSESVLEYDFYEFLIEDPSVSDEPQFFNVGNIGGRGDISIADLNNNLGMVYLTLPQDLNDLGLNYYGYDKTEYNGESIGAQEISLNLNLNSEDTKSILTAGDSEIMKAWDRIEEDERYVVEGMTDLGCTESKIQNYMANLAANSNYFYAASTVNSTNYMVIANKKQKIVQNSRKLWFGAPWDYDDGTVGYLFNCSPSVLYWETVMTNRRNGREFNAAFGQNHGIVSVVNPAKDFKKSERQLLLTKKINTIYHDLYLDRRYWNENRTGVTGELEESVMNEENNARLEIRISKAMPLLLNQFKGYQNSAKTRKSVKDVIEFWLKTTIVPLQAVQEWLVVCDESNNPDELVRKNMLQVRLDVRYYNSVKYIGGILKIYEIAGKILSLISKSPVNSFHDSFSTTI